MTEKNKEDRVYTRGSFIDPLKDVIDMLESCKDEQHKADKEFFLNLCMDIIKGVDVEPIDYYIADIIIEDIGREIKKTEEE